MEDNPAECKVCFATFTPGEEHRARSLPCGHTFCSSCLAHLLGEGHGCLACPECRVKHSAPKATHFPINYGMEALIEQLKCLVVPPERSPGRPEVAGCHKTEGKEAVSEEEKLELDCLKEKVIEMLLACGTTQTELKHHQGKLKEPRSRHMTFLTRLCDLVGENRAAIMRLDGSLGRARDLAEEGKGYVLQLQVALSRLESVATAQEAIIVMERVTSRVEQVEGWRERCSRMCGDGSDVDGALASSCQVLESTKSALSSLPAQDIAADAGSDFIGGGIGAEGIADVLVRAQHTLTPLPTHTHTLTTDDIRTLTPQVMRLLESGQVWGVYQESSGNPRSSRFTYEDGRFHMYHLCNHPPPANVYTLQVSRYLSASFDFCLLAFLDLAWDFEVRGRVYIRLDMGTPLARQFLLLCTGKHRHTYANTALFRVCGRHNPGEFVMGGDYECNDGSGGSPLLSDLHGSHRKTGAAGTVWGRWEVEGHRSTQFAITIRECQGTIPRVFGTVEEGMAVLRQAVNVMERIMVTIEECGVVITP